jgi:hypothetical protein
VLKGTVTEVQERMGYVVVVSNPLTKFVENAVSVLRPFAKSILGVVVVGFMMPAVSFAAPVVDVEKSQVSVDYTYTIANNKEVYNTIWGVRPGR